MRRYNIYPTLLNDFDLYQREVGAGDGVDPWVTEEKLLARINRVDREETEKMRKGVDFEKAVRYADTANPEFTSVLPEFIREARNAAWDIYVETQFMLEGNLIRLYGRIDYTQRDMGVDVKTTSRYEFPAFVHSFQHRVYMKAARESGILMEHFEYRITDFKNIYRETFSWKDSMNDDITRICRDFIQFLEIRKELISPELKLIEYLNGEGK